MAIILKVTDNFFIENCSLVREGKKLYPQVDGSGGSGRLSLELTGRQKKLPVPLRITLKDFKSREGSIVLFEDENSEDDIILTFESIGGNGDKTYSVRAGNYIGHFKYGDYEIDIRPRFPEPFLERMLNFANDIYLDEAAPFDARKENGIHDHSRFVLYYLFLQKLEKAYLLGLPKSYRTVHYHGAKVKGNVHINRLIRSDIPFKGKISSSTRELQEDQEIVDVLYEAFTIIETNGIPTKSIAHIKAHLREYRSGALLTHARIAKALNAKVLKNPMYAPYKKILEYAKFIIIQGGLKEKQGGKEHTFGFLVNVSRLFETYLYKLLHRKFPDWKVIHEEPLEVCKGSFIARSMYPDIVMKKENKVLVFDVKYKRMRFKRGMGDRKYGDLDRSDFFQINTYMAYYKNHGDEVVAGGLLYPMEEKYDKTVAYCESWLGNEKTKFIVDGIDLSNVGPNSTIKNLEESFLERIFKLIGESP